MKRMSHILLTCLVLALCAGITAPTAVADQRIEHVAAAAPAAIGEQGSILLRAGADDAVFSVYSITGQQIKVVRVSAGSHVSIELPRGFYIVKCNQWSRKVVVH